MKTLTLKPRGELQEGRDGVSRHVWHDYFVLNHALQGIVKGKTITRTALWYNWARRVEEAADKAGLRDVPSLAVEIDVAIKNKIARLLARELGKLQLEDFGRDMTGRPAPTHLGHLGQMLADFSKQLGHDILHTSDDEDEDEDVT